MATVCVEDDLAVQAAMILVTLKDRKLLRRPEWVEEEPATTYALLDSCFTVQFRPKQERSGGRRPWSGDYSRLLETLGLAASAGSSGDERERSPHRRERPRAPRPVRDERAATEVRRADSPRYDGTLSSGSGPSTSAYRKAARTSAVPAAEHQVKEPVMKAASPETPLDFGASAAGSGASSSGDDVARPPSKRRAAGSACSGDEGCSSPDKRARVDDGNGDKAISEPKMEETPAKFTFDLNMLPDDDGFC